MKKSILAIMTLIAIVLTGLMFFLRMTDDRQGPEIHVDTSMIQYAEGMDSSSLLVGVTATDNKDGDVTDSLRVERVLTDRDKGIATVLYTAKDKSNNVRKLSVQIPMTASTTDPQDAASQETPQDAAQDTAQTEDTQEPTATPTPVPDEPAASTGEAANEAKIAALDADAPRFYLSEYEITIQRGQSINRLNYVRDIQDDEDERDDLFQQIQIEGEVDTNTPGTYEVEYFVIDSDDNISNRAVLVVTVE